MDKRVVKTKQILQQALLALMREKSLEKIEIQEITERANTARVTFYRHYGTKEELLLDALEGFYEELKSQLGPMTINRALNFEQSPPELAFFLFLERDRALNKRLITGSASAMVQQRVRQYIVEQVIKTFSKMPGYAEVRIVLLANHIASNVIGNVMWWLAEDLPYSAEYMARLTHRMMWLGAKSLLEEPDSLKP